MKLDTFGVFLCWLVPTVHCLMSYVPSRMLASCTAPSR
jgi:hypothetical protein